MGEQQQLTTTTSTRDSTSETRSITEISASVFNKMREDNLSRIALFAERDDFQAWSKGIGLDDAADMNEAINWFNKVETCKSCVPGRQLLTLSPCGGFAFDEYKDGQFITNECENIKKHRELVEKREIDKRFTKANIPSLYRKLSFDTYKPANDSQRSALSKCREAWRAEKGLYICGPVGVGKTHLAVSALMQNFACTDKVSGYFCRVTELLQKLRPPYNDTEMMDKIESVDVLVLDDLGMQKDSEWTYEQITYVLDTRLINELTTVVTSNLTLEALAKDNLECQRIVSRVKQMCDVILIRGDDYRDKMARERK